jgi:Maltose operon periplasmic protein precursor (MalM)
MTLAGLTASLLSLVLTGCGTGGPRGIERAELHRTNATIVSGFDGATAAPIVFDTSGYSIAYIDHTAIAPLFALKLASGDRQLIHTFKLPTWISPYEVQLVSFAQGGLAEPSLYYPKLIFLDAAFKPLRESKLADFVFRNVGSQGGITANFFVNEANKNETYIAVLSESRSSFEEQLSILQSNATMSHAVPIKGGLLFFAFTTSGNEPPKKMRASETGYLELKFIRPKLSEPTK